MRQHRLASPKGLVRFQLLALRPLDDWNDIPDDLRSDDREGAGRLAPDAAAVDAFF
jgi:hypothetical protein